MKNKNEMKKHKKEMEKGKMMMKNPKMAIVIALKNSDKPKKKKK